MKEVHEKKQMKCMNPACKYKWDSMVACTHCPLCGHLYVIWLNHARWTEQ